MEQDKKFKAGFVALIGRPNVGKSTIMNNILGTKLSIVSPKPQTTRMRILGVKHDKDAQIIFLDTPGVQKGKDLLTKVVMESAVGSMEEADIIVMIIEADKGWTKEDEQILENYIKKLNKPTILVINKIDKMKDKRLLLPLIEESTQKYNFAEIIPMSAIKGENIDRFVDALKKYLPESPPLFPEDQITDLPLRFYIAEIIREKIFHNTRQELPYSAAVEVESIQEIEDKNLVVINAVIYVEKENHKGIIIGRKGQMLKKIGIQAREEIESILGKKVHLNLWVKVKPRWKEDIRLLKLLGYQYIS
ncbi:GTP-binding protein Era [Persephonella hydrogeniphila]|uniref:GTPase Era n=1 Tax=Persephonella hydrogeniphila TaxID=198703 RepID=A0A285NHX4_9AQUI|nr:GTPase Era [Persephonella hydrogeniphila]SNZ09045.1 GTP-binding protein Era [Persephonella hydrogeniphila]